MKLINSLTGTHQSITAKNNIFTLYVCGVTPYDDAHLGHGRCYVVFDLLYRLLIAHGYVVSYCRNFTDIDDKIIARAEKEFGDRQAHKNISDKYIERFLQDMDRLNVQRPAQQPRVSEYIPHIIVAIEDLIAQGRAYERDGDVYFSVASYKPYGALSNQNLDELRSGARVSVNENKRDPLDFALWKKEPEGTFYQSPWGYGRPGWHIECSVFGKECLGSTIDIHGGGMDLLFPHHENERAQSESLSAPVSVALWMHNAFVQIDKEKMSKSLGNFFTLRDLFEQYDPMVIRYYLLSHSYRAPLDFTRQAVEGAQKAYQRLSRAFEGVDKAQCAQVDWKQSSIVSRMISFLDDDLNTSGALGVLFDGLKAMQEDDRERCAVYRFMHEVYGLTLVPPETERVAITPAIQQMIDDRQAARERRDFKTADELRDKLVSLGVNLQDTGVKK